MEAFDCAFEPSPLVSRPVAPKSLDQMGLRVATPSITSINKRCKADVQSLKLITH
jgi:hypothetical protein